MVTGQEGAGVQPVLTGIVHIEADDLAGHCGRDAQTALIARSARLGDEHGLTAGQRSADRAEHPADPLFAGIHLSFESDVAHVCHASAFDAHRLVLTKADLDQWTVVVACNRVIHHFPPRILLRRKHSAVNALTPACSG